MVSTEVIHLIIPSSAKYIAAARNIVESLCPRLPLTTEQIDDLKLAIGEACSNAIKFSKPSNSAVHVLYGISPGRIEIEVRNRGPGLKRRAGRANIPGTEEIHEGGLGVYLIDQVMDEVAIESKAGTTSVRMAKLLK